MGITIFIQASSILSNAGNVFYDLRTFFYTNLLSELRVTLKYVTKLFRFSKVRDSGKPLPDFAAIFGPCLIPVSFFLLDQSKQFFVHGKYNIRSHKFQFG